MTAIPNLGHAWSSLETPLDNEILDTLSTLGFTNMTPVQQGTIPLFMKYKDVVVEAVTGSGKTLAFVIPVIEKILRREQPLDGNEIGALIISPTRELAQQIYSVFDQFTCHHSRKESLTVGLFIGGATSIAQDVASFKESRPRIMVGTPGRLEEMLTLRSKLVDTREMEVLVLDEADRLLDMGFTQQLAKIMQQLPKQRRTGLFSATMTDAVSELVRAGLRNPARIVVKVEDLLHGNVQRTPSTLSINYLVCDAEQKLLQTIRLLQAELALPDGARKCIIYFATCACVEYFYKLLSRHPDLSSFSVFALHGQMDTKRRTGTYTSFNNVPSMVPSLLLCTDVASRGLDIPEMDYVIQFDPPQDPKSFSHRCGRAGRAGRRGKATVILLRGREEMYVDLLIRRKIPLQRVNYLLSDGTHAEITSHIRDDDVEETVKIEDSTLPAFIQSLRDVVRTDRDLHDRGMKAFVSWVRAYTKHEASFVFRLQDVSLASMANSYGLLKLPDMPELRQVDTTQEFTPEEMDWVAYKYSNHQREAARQRALAEPEKKSSAQKKRTKPKESVPWSKKIEAKARKVERREKKERKREFLKRKKAEDEQSGNGHQGDDDDDNDGGDDWEELAKEERLAKKLKKGKMSQEAFDDLLLGEIDQTE